MFMGMADKMKERSFPGTSVARSSKIIKSIDKDDVFELNNVNELIALQNRKEYIASAETFEGYKSMESPYVKKLVR